MKRRNAYLVAGMSGSGKSVCLKHFEDMEYNVIRGLPVEYLDSVLSSSDNIAIEIFSKPLIEQKDEVLKIIEKNNLNVIFLDASDHALILRYKESRRRHPLNSEFVQDGISTERAELAEIRNIADFVIDSSNTTPYELKMIMNKEIFKVSDNTKVIVMSFSYKKGIPVEADCVFDVRFLKNPYYDVSLREMNGAEEKIQEYLKSDINVTKFIIETERYLDVMIDLLKQEGRCSFHIAFGCTGGFHRSVFVAETIAKHLNDNGVKASILHRDLKVIKN